MSKRLLNNGHLATGPQPHVPYSMASQQNPPSSPATSKTATAAPTATTTTAPTGTPRQEHSRINKVENLLQGHSPPRDHTPAADSAPAVSASPYTTTASAMSSGSSSHHGPSSQQHQQTPQSAVRRTRQHAATISEPMAPQLTALRSPRGPLPQQSPQHQQSQQQGGRYFHPQTPPQSQQSTHPHPHPNPPLQLPLPLPPPHPQSSSSASSSHYHNQQLVPPPPHPHSSGSPHDVRPRRMTFIGTPVNTDAPRDHYEMSFSRSTSSHYAPSSQSSPQRPFVANSGNSSSNNNNNNSSSGGNAMATPTTAPQSYSTRPPLYIPSHGHHNSQHQIPLQPPPPASAPSNQQHFNLSSGYQNQQQQHHQQQQQHQQQPGGRLAPFGHRASYSGGGGGGAGQGMLPLQRSLSPPPHGRRYLPVPGRYDIGGKLQRSPLPFPRIPSPKLQQRQQQQQGMMHQQHQQQHQPQQRLSPPSATAPLATVVANAAGNSSGGAGNSITAHSPARESTRRLSSVVWGPTGFERLESGMSRCRICHKEYSKGSSTGTLKRHFRQHQVNVGPGGSYARRSPPVTASVASATSVAASAAATAVATTPTSAPAVHHVQRPRAYSHRTETRTNREASPLLSAPRLHFQQNQLQQNQLQQNLRVGSADVDSSSAIAGSALLSMAAGDSRMDVDTRPVRRPTRLSDPSVYPAPSSAGATTIDPETRDISVSPSPSTAASARDDARQTVRTVQIPQLPPPKMETGSDSDSESDNDSHASQRPHKRRRATDASAHSIARTTSPGLLPSGALSAAELVALSSELMLRVAQALPTLALEAADSQRASDACRTGDPLDVLLGHIRTRLLADSSESVPRLNGSGSAGVGAVPSSGSPHNTKTPLWSPRPASPPSSSSSALLSPFYSLLSASTNRLPFTVRKAHPRPVTTTATMTLLSRVSAAMQRIAPLSLAELKWDNVGILLEAAQPRTAASRVFLTIDLTSETLREALDDPAVGVIVAYHPPIFSAWKSLTMSDNKQSLILRCASAGVSIYTPHTSLDSCEDGINDWLAASVGEGAVVPITPASPEVAAAAGQHNAGSGRLVTLATPLPLSAVVERVKQRLGLERIRVARASCHDGPSDTQTLVSRVAVCAGSGYSVVSAATTTTSSPKVDVYLTGEMGHHDALAATAAGTSCILGEHSNTERGYLRAVLAERLQRELDTDNGDSDSGSVSVVVSLVDKDPISIE